MKRFRIFLLCVIMVFSSVFSVSATEVGQEEFGTLNVIFSGTNNYVETLNIMIKNNHVYANAVELGERLGYHVGVSDDAVLIYNSIPSDTDEGRCLHKAHI